MSATISSSQPTPASAAPATPEVTLAEINVSCQIPVMLLFVSAALWLVAGSFMGLIASLNFHGLRSIFDCAALSYGRLHPAATNAFIYGFAIPAGLGVLLWLVCRLGRTTLAGWPFALAGWLLWNLGVTAGILGIFWGESTGQEWLEMPRYGSVPILFGYLSIALSAMMTFHERKERSLEIPHLFLLAAVFWFPWIYSTAIILTCISPARGVVQAIVDGWFAHNLLSVWFTFVGLATLFYLAPAIAKKPIHSRPTALFAFWVLLFFGSWGGVAAGAPVPSWIPALGAAGAMITLTPVLATTANLFKTLMGGECKSDTEAVPLFIAFAPMPFLAAGLAAALVPLAPISAVVNFTWFVPGLQQLALYGFFAITIFGAIYHIAPQLLQTEFASQGPARTQFFASAAGMAIFVVALALGGTVQGFKLSDSTVSFADASASTGMFFKMSTIGELGMVVGNVLLLVNLARLLLSAGRTTLASAMAANVKPLGVTS